MKVNYALFNPSGNITALVDTYVDKDDRVRVANKIMEMEPSCEQVGYVAVNGDFVMLEMAGGEFCGNASRCAAVFKNKNKVLCSAYFQMMNTEISGNNCKLTVPTLPTGIDIKVFNSAPYEGAEDDIKKETNPTGYMFLEKLFEPDGTQGKTDEPLRFKMTPLIYIPKSGTLFWENSCGSGSMATAQMLARDAGKDLTVCFNEPGGELTVSAKLNGELSLSGEITKIKENSFFYQYDGVVLYE